MLIDLSHKIQEGMPNYPDDIATRIDYVKTLEKDGYALSEYQTSMHTGTHLDFPSHLYNSDKRACDYPLARFHSKGWIIDVRGIKDILVCESFEKVEVNDIVILYTGFYEYFGKEEYFTSHPVISENAALYFSQKKISILGFDMPSCDYYPFLTHKILMKNDIIILENLTNLEELNKSSKSGFIDMVYTFPLKISAEASQTRTVAYVI